jgi:hypothetical protein
MSSSNAISSVSFANAGNPPHPLVSSSPADAYANIAHGVAGHAEWLDAEKTKIVIMLKSPSEWADAIYAWVDKSGQQGTVCTIHELMNGSVKGPHCAINFLSNIRCIWPNPFNGLPFVLHSYLSKKNIPCNGAVFEVWLFPWAAN